MYPALDLACHGFATSLWMERGAIVDQHDLLVLNMNDKIFVSVLVTDLSGNRRQILAVTEEDGAGIDTCMRGITAGNLNYLYMTIEIEKDKMGRVLLTIVMSHHSIHLEGTGATVVNIVLVSLPPGKQTTDADQEDDRNEHANTDGHGRKASGPLQCFCIGGHDRARLHAIRAGDFHTGASLAQLPLLNNRLIERIMRNRRSCAIAPCAGIWTG